MKKHKNLLIVVLIFIIFALFLQVGYVYAGKVTVGWDTTFHNSIIFAYRQSLMNGNFFPKGILPSLGYNLGYGTPLFYPTFFHYITAWISLFFKFCGEYSVAAAMVVVNYLNFLLSAIWMYKLSLLIFKRQNVAIFSGLIYMIIPFHVSQIITRGSYSESWLFVFLPLLCIGVYKLITKNYKSSFGYLTISLVGGMYSHPMTFLFCVILLFPLTFFYFKDIYNKNGFTIIVLSSFTFLCLIAPVWLNLLYLKHTGDYLVFAGGEGMQTFEGFASSFKALDSFFIYPSNEYTPINTSINIFIIVMCIVSIVSMLVNKKAKVKKIFFVILGATIIYMLLQSKLFAIDWVVTHLLGMQFIVRLFVLCCLGISLIAPVFIMFINKKLLLYISYVVIILCSIFASLNNIVYAWEPDAAHSLPFYKYDREEAKKLTKFQPNDTPTLSSFGLQHEYLQTDLHPLGSQLSPEFVFRFGQGPKKLSGDGTLNILSFNNDKITFSVSGTGTSTFELPRIYYPGYELTGGNGGGAITRSNDGFVTISVESSNDPYYLTFVGNQWSRIGYKIQLLTIVILILYLIINIIKRKFVASPKSCPKFNWGNYD